MKSRIAGMLVALALVLGSAAGAAEPAAAAPAQTSGKASAARAAQVAAAKAKAAKAAAAKRAAAAAAARAKAGQAAADAAFRIGTRGVALTNAANAARVRAKSATRTAALVRTRAASAARTAVVANARVVKLRKAPKRTRTKAWAVKFSAAKLAAKRATTVAVQQRRAADRATRVAAVLIKRADDAGKRASRERAAYAAAAPARARSAAAASAAARTKAARLTAVATSTGLAAAKAAKAAARLRAHAAKVSKSKATAKVKARAREAAAAATKAAVKAVKQSRTRTAAAVSARAAARTKAAWAAKTATADGRFPTWAPRDSLIFNNPRGSKARQLAIISQLNRAIDATPAGGEIKMAQYLFDLGSVASKLIAAHRRGVSVQILIDDGESNRHIRRVRKALGTDKSARSFVAICHHSCMSNGASTIHSKYYLFSVAGRARFVSMISSANPYTGNTFNSWNNNHTIVGNTVIYDSLSRYFTDMLADTNNPNYFRITKSGKYTMYLYPQQPRTPNDLVLTKALNQVNCKVKAKGYGTGGRTLIRLANWGWTGARIDVAQRIWKLWDQGCRVQVMINKGRITRGVLKVLLKRSAKYGKLPVYDAWYDKNGNDVAGLYLHDKMLTINGTLNGKPVKHTWTGSQNLTSLGTLSNNDIILRINDAAVTDAYNTHFAYVRSQATRRMHTVPLVTRVKPPSER